MSDLVPGGVDRSARALRILGGEPTPPGLADDLRALVRLPGPAQAAFWTVLGPCLVEPLPADTEAMLDAFSRTHELDRDELARPLKASRFVLREAARADVERAEFAEDVGALVGPDHAAAVHQVLLAGFAAARTFVRQEILQGTLADHGKLLTGVDWRVDSIQSSNRGPKMRVPVTTLTLRYREGEKTRRITLQLLPDVLRQMKAILNELAP